MKGQEPSLGWSLEQKLRHYGVTQPARQKPPERRDKRNGRKPPERGPKEESIMDTTTNDTQQHHGHVARHPTEATPAPRSPVDAMEESMRSVATDVRAIRASLSEPLTWDAVGKGVVAGIGVTVGSMLLVVGLNAAANWLFGTKPADAPVMGPKKL